MQVATILKKMFPNASKDDFEVTRYADDSWGITKWNLQEPQPTQEELEAYWVVNEQEILTEQQPKPSELELLKKQQTDLVFELMMNGVL